jgi:hypothetical protein
MNQLTKENTGTIKNLLALQEEFESNRGGMPISTSSAELVTRRFVEHSDEILDKLRELRNLESEMFKLKRALLPIYGTDKTEEIILIANRKEGVDLLKRMESAGFKGKLSPAEEELVRVKYRLTTITGRQNVDEAIDVLVSKWLPGELAPAVVKLNTPTEDLPMTSHDLTRSDAYREEED